MRQIVLDTETTGIDPRKHRIIEIGCVEIIDRKLTGRHYHVYINPEREVEKEAFAVHGISDDFLADKAKFTDIVAEFVEFIEGAELVIHNAPFDVGHMDAEFKRLAAAGGRNFGQTDQFCSVLDTLAMARKMYPGAKNNLDALCRRLGVENAHRDLHGALLDAEILADVYLLMTGGQTDLTLSMEQADSSNANIGEDKLANTVTNLPVLSANANELEKHQQLLQLVAQKSGDQCIWSK